MRRRLDIAMSIMSEPSIIFLDEPTTGLDPQNRSAMWELVQSLAEKGTTIFLTTQYLEEAEILADKIAILSNGEIIKEGTSEELKQSLPQGIIEFTFHNIDDLESAGKNLSDYYLAINEKDCTLTLHTDGSLDQLSTVINKIREIELNIVSFRQKLPTLEDAFYQFIKNEAEA